MEPQELAGKAGRSLRGVRDAPAGTAEGALPGARRLTGGDASSFPHAVPKTQAQVPPDGACAFLAPHATSLLEGEDPVPRMILYEPDVMSRWQRIQDAFASFTGTAAILLAGDGREITAPSNFGPPCDRGDGLEDGGSCREFRSILAERAANSGGWVSERCPRSDVIYAAHAVPGPGGPVGELVLAVGFPGRAPARVRSTAPGGEEAVEAGRFLLEVLLPFLQSDAEHGSQSGLVAGTTALHELSLLAGRRNGLEGSLRLILESAIRATGAERGKLSFWMEPKGEISVELAGFSPKAPVDGDWDSSHCPGGGRRDLQERGAPWELESVGDEDGLGNALVYFPVTVGGEEAGSLSLTKRGDGFSEHDLNLLRLLAVQSGLVAERARLYEDLHLHLSEMALLGELSMCAVSGRSLEEVLGTLVSGAARAFRAPMSVVRLLDPGTRKPLVCEGYGFARNPAGRSALRAAKELVELVVLEGRPCLVPELARDPRFRVPEGPKGSGVVSALVVPLTAGDENRIIGALGVFDRVSRDFGEADERFIGILARFAIVSIENLRLSVRQGEQERILEGLVGSAVQAQENERKMMALEIHDAISQSIASLFYRVEACDRLLATDLEKARSEFNQIKSMVAEITQDVTRLMLRLRPPGLKQLGVFAALKQHIDRFRKEQGIAVRMEVRGQRQRFDPAVELTVYRVVQEALTNVRKHSGATRVRIGLELNDDKLHGVVADNGTGFNPEEPKGDRNFGLFSMKERTSLLGGKLEIVSASGRGTKILFEVPVVPGKRKAKL